MKWPQSTHQRWANDECDPAGEVPPGPPDGTPGAPVGSPQRTYKAADRRVRALLSLPERTAAEQIELVLMAERAHDLAPSGLRHSTKLRAEAVAAGRRVVTATFPIIVTGPADQAMIDELEADEGIAPALLRHDLEDGEDG